MTTEAGRLKLLASRCALERLEREHDRIWLIWMRAEPGTIENRQRLQELHELDLCIARRRREIAEIQGRPWLSVAT
jgi:hypothetical protein